MLKKWRWPLPSYTTDDPSTISVTGMAVTTGFTIQTLNEALTENTPHA
jgi:hypothetical protein